MSKFEAVKMTPKMVSCMKSVAEIQKEYGIPNSVLRELIERTKEEEARQRRQQSIPSDGTPWPYAQTVSTIAYNVTELTPPLPVRQVSFEEAGQLIQQSIDAMTPPCPDCHGTGEYLGLLTVEPCRTCRKAVQE